MEQNKEYWEAVEKEALEYFDYIEKDPVGRAENKLYIKMLKEEIRRGLSDEVFF